MPPAGAGRVAKADVGEPRWVYYPGKRTRRRAPMGLQVKFAAGGLLALLAISMGVAILLVVGLDQDQTHLNDRDVPYGSAINEAALNAKAVANDQRSFLLSGDPRYFEEANRRIAAARAAFKRALALADSGAQRQAVSAAPTGFDRWVEVVHGEFASFQQGNKNGAIGGAVAYWLVRSIAGPISRLASRLGLPS
jgi:hypothetical protein